MNRNFGTIISLDISKKRHEILRITESLNKVLNCAFIITNFDLENSNSLSIIWELTLRFRKGISVIYSSRNQLEPIVVNNRPWIRITGKI